MANISVSQDGVEEGKGPIDENAGIHRQDLGLSGFLDEDELSGG